MFDIQGMVFALRRARKEHALMCESVEKHILFPLQCATANTDRNLPFRGTFLGATAGCLNSISFAYGVLFADRHGFNAIDTFTGKQLYLPSRDYRSDKSELGTG